MWFSYEPFKGLGLQGKNKDAERRDNTIQKISKIIIVDSLPLEKSSREIWIEV